jgi:hypothetical protein
MPSPLDALHHGDESTDLASTVAISAAYTNNPLSSIKAVPPIYLRVSPRLLPTWRTLQEVAKWEGDRDLRIDTDKLKYSRSG